MKQFYFLFSFLLYASVVAGQEYVHLQPEAVQGHMEQGREYLTLVNGELVAELAFDGVFESYYVFDLVLVNQGGEVLSVDPASFHYLHLDHAHADSSVLPPILAARPGHILEQYETLLKQDQKPMDIHTVLAYVEAGIEAFSTASALWATEEHSDLLPMEMDVVSEDIMKKGSIPPGKGVNGFVFFPIFDEPGYLMFSIPVEDRLFQFVYRQD